MTAYLLRDIDPKLWRRVTDRAQRDGLTLRAVLLLLLKAYARGDVTIKTETASK